MFGKHAYDKTGRTVTALRPAVLDHGLLHFGEAAGIGQRFDGVDLLTCDRGQGNKTAVNGLIESAAGAGSDQQDGTGTALALRAAFLGSGETAGANEIKERELRRDVAYSRGFAVQNEPEIVGDYDHNRFYSGVTAREL